MEHHLPRRSESFWCTWFLVYVAGAAAIVVRLQLQILPNCLVLIAADLAAGIPLLGNFEWRPARLHRRARGTISRFGVGGRRSRRRI